MTDGFAQRSATRTRAIARYARRRTIGGSVYLRAMMAPAEAGTHALTETARRDALRSDVALRSVGVRCLWRSAVVAELLRETGFAAHVGFSVSTNDPRRAHAECEVGGVPLRPHDAESVRLR